MDRKEKKENMLCAGRLRQRLVCLVLAALLTVFPAGCGSRGTAAEVPAEE